jgi:plastocyanin
MRRLICLALASTSLLAAGCGGSDNKSSTGAGQTGGSSAGGGTTVAMKDIKFQPETVNVPVGEKITWVNEDSVQHDVVNVQDNEQPHSQLFNKGGSYSWTPAKAGTIDYVCTVHPNMTGKIVVK